MIAKETLNAQPNIAVKRPSSGNRLRIETILQPRTLSLSILMIEEGAEIDRTFWQT